MALLGLAGVTGSRVPELHNKFSNYVFLENFLKQSDFPLTKDTRNTTLNYSLFSCCSGES